MTWFIVCIVNFNANIRVSYIERPSAASTVKLFCMVLIENFKPILIDILNYSIREGRKGSRPLGKGTN